MERLSTPTKMVRVILPQSGSQVLETGALVAWLSFRLALPISTQSLPSNLVFEADAVKRRTSLLIFWRAAQHGVRRHTFRAPRLADRERQ